MKRNKRGADRGLTVIKGKGRRFSMESIKQAILFYLLLLLAIGLIVQLLYHWLGEQYLSWRLQIVAAEAGSIDQDAVVDGLIIRDEEVVIAPGPGVVLELVSPGERVYSGAEVASLGIISPAELKRLLDSIEEAPEAEPEKDLIDRLLESLPGVDAPGVPDPAGRPGSFDLVDSILSDPGAFEPENVNVQEVISLYSENPGLVSHYIDGWETAEESLHLPQNPSPGAFDSGYFRTEGDLIEAGRPVLKIVNNWKWLYNVTLPLHPGRPIAEQGTVELEFDFNPGRKVEAELYRHEIDERAGEVRLSYLVKVQVPGFDQARRSRAVLLYDRVEGIIIPVGAVFSKEGESGVFLNRGGRVVFEPVRVIEKFEETAFVEGLALNSMVITRPELVEEGRRLN